MITTKIKTEKTRPNQLSHEIEEKAGLKSKETQQ